MAAVSDRVANFDALLGAGRGGDPGVALAQALPAGGTDAVRALIACVRAHPSSLQPALPALEHERCLEHMRKVTRSSERMRELAEAVAMLDRVAPAKRSTVKLAGLAVCLGEPLHPDIYNEATSPLRALIPAR